MWVLWGLGCAGQADFFGCLVVAEADRKLHQGLSTEADNVCSRASGVVNGSCVDPALEVTSYCPQQLNVPLLCC
jgi:hypothetical protein